VNFFISVTVQLKIKNKVTSIFTTNYNKIFNKMITSNKWETKFESDKLIYILNYI